MRHRLLFCCLGFLLTLLSCSKDERLPGNIFVKYYGATGTQSSADVVAPEQQRGYVSLASSDALDGSTDLDFALIFTDTAGEEIRTQVYANTGADLPSSLRECPDGGFIMGGTTLAADGSTLGRVIRTTPDGTLQWQKALFSAANSEAGTQYVLPLNDGYLAVGFTTAVDMSKPQYNPFTDSTDLYVVKLDLTGNVLWEVVRGFPGNDRGIGAYVSGNSYVIVGSTTLSPSTQKAFWSVRLNSQGGTVEQYSYSLGNTSINVQSFAALSDGAVALTGTDGSGHLVLAVLEPNLQQRVAPKLLDVQADGCRGVMGMVETNDGGLAMNVWLSVNANTGNTDILLVKTNETGDYQWSERYGGEKTDSPGGLAILPGGFLIGGTIDLITNKMITLIKTNSVGQLR